MPSISFQKKIIDILPKTEIHLHLEGLASVDTLWHMINENDIQIGIKTHEQLQKKFRVHNLNEFIDLFINVIQACIRQPDDINLLIDDAESYLSRNNIRYAEIFYSPTKLIRNGIRFEELVNKLTDGADRIEKNSGIIVRFITDVSRSFGVDNAEQNFLNHLKYASKTMIGLGLGGAERNNNAKKFRHIFRKAREMGMVVVAHAGEDVGAESIWETIKYLNVMRIGHGLSAFQDPALIKYLRKIRMPIEVCPTSNLYTGRYVKNISNHPIRTFYDNGLFITVNTDDPTPFRTELNEEYAKLLESAIFSFDEIITLIHNGVDATFLPNNDKKNLHTLINETLQSHNVQTH